MTKQQIINKIQECENELSRLDKEINHLDIIQYTRKILINRIYGTFANKYSPFCDVDAASSITLTGQACIKQSSKIVNQYLGEKYDINDLDLTIYGDTDSNYFTIQPILDKLKQPFFTKDKKINKIVYDIADEISEILNIEIKKWAQNSLNSIDPRFVFKRESICDAGIFIQKKRYILHILDDEGFETDKMKYVGVEIKRSDIPKATKPLIKHIIETMVQTRDYKATNDAYFEAFEKFKNMPIHEIAFPRGLHNFGKYLKASSGFQTAKHTPVHAKAAIFYNTLLDEYKVSNKYEKITGGAKIKWFYTEKNKWNLSVIGFADTYPEEFELKVNQEKMFNKIVASAVERLYNAVGWRIKNPSCQETVDLFELLG